MPLNSVLAGGRTAELGLSSCGPVESGQVVEETESSFSLVFPLNGMFRVEVRDRRISATPAKVLFFGHGQSHLISHPVGGHDSSAFITVAPILVGPFLDDRGRLEEPAAPTRPSTEVELRSMLARAKVGQLPALDIESFAVDTFHWLSGSSATDITHRHRRLVDDTEEYLSTHLDLDCDLPTIANAVGASPHHLSRVFKRVTGESMSQRRMRLRLNEAMRHIEEGADDLSRVAVASGFYDHSHLTNSFKRHFGVSPTEMRMRIRR